MNETDFDTLKDIFEMAEVLTHEGENTLEISAFDERTNKIGIITFRFNDNRELTEDVTIEE
mgnify:CR=1 FL=1